MLQSERYENDADNNAERFMVYVMIVISRVERRRKWKIDLQHMEITWLAQRKQTTRLLFI
ncbi:MAG: hypothetical protein ACLSV5_08180 [Clostridium sp.]|uniref:hypothetical protein n=1 Tax=Eubacterium sp. TaxID=142586 RepID=UPI001EBD68B6|nr:hypothetical protein [Roseburia sp.]MBS7186849.1 hypothetical protein [Clostridium sp.]